MSDAVLDLSSFLDSSPPPPRREHPPDGSAEILRLRLAVRGWAPPLGLLGGQADARRVLDSLACEVETAVETRPGQWLLSVSVRRQELAARTRSELRGAVATVYAGDADDPVRQAFALALEGSAATLTEIGTPVLSALTNVREWLGGHWDLHFSAAEIAGELALRSLDADLEKMTRQPMVGQVHRRTLDTLIAFATEPAHASLSVSYVYGGGGSGKTTLLAFLQQSLRKRVPVVRIDFDEPGIDARRQVTLNLALCEQLAGVVPDMDFRIGMLREIAAMQGSAGLSRAGRHASNRFDRQAQARESYALESASDHGSILYAMLASITGPVVIIFDTVELVLARSDADASELASWLKFLRDEAQAKDIRVVMAGRDPQDAGQAGINLITRLEGIGAAIHEAVELPELTPDEAAELLRHCGLDDEAEIALAAHAVPGNPLLLRITGDGLKQADPQMRDAVRQAHGQSRIDPASARNYLLRRVVAHVSDPFARPYVLAAMFSPLICAEFLAQVVMPCVDRQAHRSVRPSSMPEGQAQAALMKGAERVFRAICGTHWLTRPSRAPEGWVAFNRDIRAFALKLMAVADDGIVQERDLRQSAANFHLTRVSPHDSALALYQRALLGHVVEFPGEREVTRDVLVDVLEELPASLRQWLGESAPTQHFTEPPAPGTFKVSAGMTALQWRRYLEGDDKREGEGAMLVEADHAREALALYLERPTRPKGNPPTFVLQALADLGDWDSELADIQGVVRSAMVDKGKVTSLSPMDFSRIYWITRLELLRAKGRLSDPHIDLIRRISSSRPASRLTALASLLSVAEAVRGERFMDGEMRAHALRVDPIPRTLLATKTPFLVPAGITSLMIDEIAVAQADWLQRVTLLRPALSGGADMERLQNAQEKIQKLSGEPMAQVNLVFRSLRERIGVRLKSLDDLSQQILLLRGTTTEFHRPLREALLTFFEYDNATAMAPLLFGPTLQQMSIQLAEMQPDAFFQRAASNPRAWCTAFVSYADRCRLLPSLCERLVEHGDAKAKRIASSFLSWDRALCGGRSSDWQQMP